MLASLLILLPLVLLLIAAAALVLIYWSFPKFGFSWLIAAVTALFAWVSILVMRSRLPVTLQFPGWLPLGAVQIGPGFQLDSVSWPYAMGLVTLSLAVILTATARSQHQTNPPAWAGSLALTALGLAAVFSANPLTLMLTWTTIDVVELVILLTNLPDRAMSARPVVGFAARLAGTLIVFWAGVVGSSAAGSSNPLFASPTASLICLVGIGLRLGIFPLHLTFPQEPPMRRGLGNVLRLVPVVSSLALLGRFPAVPIETPLLPVLLGFTALGTFYGSLLWATAADELNGRPYWVIGMAALIVTCVIRGNPGESIIWGLALLMAGGNLFLFSAREKRVLFLPLLGLWGISGLPFSPTGDAWTSFTTTPMVVFNLIYLVAHVLLVYGYLRHALQPGDSLSSFERWVSLVYPLGILVLPFVHALAGFEIITGFHLESFWWVGIVTTGLGVGLYIWQRRAMRVPEVERTAFEQPTLSWVRAAIGRVFRVFSSVFRLDWLYQIVWTGYRGLGNVVGSLTTILEGDGGVLWVLVLLALFLTLLRTGGAR